MKRGTRDIDFDIDIGAHEVVKKLANECNPPISQSAAINLLLQLGINTFIFISRQGEKIEAVKNEISKLDNKPKDLDKFIKEAEEKEGDAYEII